MPSTLCILLLGVFTVQALRVWPQPTLVEQGSDAQWVSRTFGLVAKLYCEENGTQVQKVLSYDTLRGLIQNISDWLRFYPSEQTNHELSEELILRDAVSRSLQTIKTTKFVPWKTHSRLSAFEPSPAVVDKPVMLNQLQLNQVFCPSADKLDSVAFFAGDESYELTVEQETASINSRSTLGSIRALQTFEQLFYASSNRSDVYIPNTPLQISDKPRWPHRGLLLDIARNVFSTEDVLRTIDAMASSKLNRLHLHATDSQSWPIEVPAFPHLASQGAYQPDQIWSSADLRRVQRYGVIRGVSVFLEIDMPGHTASIAHAYPDLIAAFNEPDWSNFAAEPLSGQLKLNSAPVYAFVDKLFVSKTFSMQTRVHSKTDRTTQILVAVGF
jgi:hexosaminidase